MPGRIRTFDRPIKSRMLYQLSYGHALCGERLFKDIFRSVNTHREFNLFFVGKLSSGHNSVISGFRMAAIVGLISYIIAFAAAVRGFAASFPICHLSIPCFGRHCLQ